MSPITNPDLKITLSALETTLNTSFAEHSTAWMADSHPLPPITPWEETLVEMGEFLENREYKLDGIDGYFEFVSRIGYYPYTHRVIQIHHQANLTGQQSEAYRAIKRQLGDDWSTDMTANLERLVAILCELGFDRDTSTSIHPDMNPDVQFPF